MENKITRIWIVALLFSAGVNLTACATSPVRNAQLEQAKRHYEKASRDVDTVRRASDQLDSARDALEMADTRQIINAKSHIAHYLYLFDQHMRMAEMAVEQRDIQEKLEERLAEKVEMTAMMDTVVRVEDAVDTENWDLLLAAANAAGLTSADDDVAEQPKDSDRGNIMTLGDVLFKVNGTTLASGAQGMIDNLVLFLNRNSSHMAEIEGHTDDSGSAAFNKALSRDRAIAVQTALVKAGIAGHRLAVRGVGESDPVASNRSESGRRLNRRVDVVLLK